MRTTITTTLSLYTGYGFVMNECSLRYSLKTLSQSTRWVYPSNQHLVTTGWNHPPTHHQSYSHPHTHTPTHTHTHTRQTSQKKFSECLQLNSLSVSMLDPASLQLDVPSVDFLAMFPPRPFDLGIKLYREIADNLTGSPWQQSCSQEFIYNFGGMTSDLQSLPLANSPLEKLQLLTSAFRKCMASLSRLKLKPLLEECAESADLNQAAVSCDDLLPVLVLVLLQAHPSLITALHVDTVFLNDYIAPFLASGWHGYSLATFSSVVQIISQL